MFTITTATKKVAGLKKRIRALQGGTSASKTISTLQVLTHKAQSDYICVCGKRGCTNDSHDAKQRVMDPKITSIVSESLPHLRKGAMRDFLNIMQTHGYFEEARWNKTDSIYTFDTGSIIEFFGADQASKVRGPRRDRLYMNECNNMSFENFEQLEVRTREEIYLDWNPTNEFWFYTDVLGKRDDVDHIILTYKDNEALEKTIVDSIEQRMSRKDWWQVFGLGLLGELEGKIYRDWSIIEEVPQDAKLERYGVDFGYTNDPTAIVAVYRHGDGFILDEVLFQKGMLNSQIASVIQNQENNVLCVCDSAEPKSIDELASYGIPVLGAKKGRDSVKQGIDLVQDQRISLTKRSVNIIKEYRNYMWEVDKDGKVLNVPEGGYDHSMDALRYALGSMPRLVQPLTDEQKRTRTFMSAMKKKGERQRTTMKRERKFVR